MKSFMSYIIIMLAAIFWLFRVVVCFTYSLNMEFTFTPYNYITEVIILFVTILAVVLMMKRNKFGAFLYFFMYAIYFGFSAYNPLIAVINNSSSVTDMTNLFISLVAILLGLFAVVDSLLDRTRTSSRSSKVTGWFYDTNDYEREKDERADKNNYKL